MRRLLLFLMTVCLPVSMFSQTSVLKGVVKDENAVPLAYAPVVLLYPADSTLAFYGVSNEQGLFEIKNVKSGSYLLQATLMGHLTVIKNIMLPLTNGGDAGTIILKSAPVKLKEVVVADEHVPMQFKKDTIEYNTAAFVTKPDAVVEDLLKKLPGIDVDRSGNIKALGEDVKKVLVDGREFFGSDQKLATRNVPADALKKVQVFDRKSDESEFTGIDDGTRDKTLNLLLKDDRKNAIFGELLAGGGNDGYYEGSGKVYKFNEKNQFAVLGMVNNINQSGFSFKDYVDFNGGLQSLSGHSGGVQIKISNGPGSSFPINFGDQQSGLATSGAAGFNYSHQFRKDSRIFMSYIANGSDRDLKETTSSKNFTDSGTFQESDSLNEFTSNRTHRLNFGLRDRIDSARNLIVNGSATLSSGWTRNNSGSVLSENSIEQSRLSAGRRDNVSRFSGNLEGSYLKLLNRGKSVFRVSADGSYTSDLGNNLWSNITIFSNPATLISNDQYQDDRSALTDLSVTSSMKFKIGKLLYIEPEIKAGRQNETLHRSQGTPSEIKNEIDSLSPDFSSSYSWLRPEISFIRNTDKVQLSLGLEEEISNISNVLNKSNLSSRTGYYFLPEFSWEYEYKSGRRLRAYFQSMVNVPSVNQLLPVINYSNPLALSSGNPYLKPEKSYSLAMNWWIFDQFSFTSLLTDVSATYTRDKINWNRTVDKNLVQFMSLTNVPDDYRIRSSASFSTPVRSAGIKINIDFEDTWNRGLSYVNEIENINSNLTNKLSVSLENRRKTKIDVTGGGSFQFTDARFSIDKSLNNRYTDLSFFTEFRYNPGKHLNLQFNSEVTKYGYESFGKSITVPLLSAEMSYYFLKNNRATLTLRGSDLLNRDTGIQRISEFNYLRERRSNMLGRFFMLTFKYKLNKFGNGGSGFDVKINRR